MNKRLFFALWPDNRQRETLRDAMSPLARQVEGKAVYRGNWHVTLVFVGDFPEERIPALQRAVADIPVEPFRLRFGTMSFWQRPKIAALETRSVPQELTDLVERLHAATADFGVEPEKHTYRPHITAVRIAKPFEPLQLARPLELSFSSFELIESESFRGEVTYRPLKQ